MFRAVDTRLRREVAIKRVQLLAGQEDAHQVRTRALREAQASARLNNPAVVTVYDVVEEDRAIWLVMELVTGPSLAQIVVDEGPLLTPRAANIGLGVLTALEAAHLVGVVHRDVKPANVLVIEGDRAKLTDFGVATIRDESRVTATGLIVGSPSYMAPEQATGGEITASTDLWALGAMLYFSVEGTPPFQAGSALATASAVVHGEPRPQQNRGPLTPLISRLLVKDPAARARAGEVRAALTRIARDDRRRRPRPRRDPAAGATQLMPATPPAFTPVAEPAPAPSSPAPEPAASTPAPSSPAPEPTASTPASASAPPTPASGPVATPPATTPTPAAAPAPSPDRTAVAASSESRRAAAPEPRLQPGQPEEPTPADGADATPEPQHGGHEPEAEPEPAPTVEPAAAPTVVLPPSADPTSVATPDRTVEPEPDATPDPIAEPTETAVAPASVPEPGAGATRDRIVEPTGPAVAPASVPEPEPDATRDPVAEPTSAAETGSAVTSEIVSESEPGPEPDPGPEAGPAVTSETVSEPEPGPEPDPGPET
ncbi:MAG: protein kinase, partial [Acidimicrobiales bacterium]|nr:protein kinase [Acidimicrobiales bacterium]